MVLTGLKGVWGYSSTCASLLGRVYILLAKKGDSVGCSGWDLKLDKLSSGSWLLFPVISVSSHVCTAGSPVGCCHHHCDQVVPDVFAVMVHDSVALGHCPSFCTRNESFREATLCSHQSSASAHPGDHGAMLPARFIPTPCGKSFPGIQNPALVCDHIPGITKPGCSTLLPSRCIAVWTPSRITLLCRHTPPMPCSGFSLGGICCADSTVQRVAVEQGWGGGSGPFKPLSMRFTRLRASCSFLLLPSLAGVVC